MLYSSSTSGFYSVAVHSKNIPSDATDESTWALTHTQLLEGQSKGKVIISDKYGRPILTDPAAPTEAQLKVVAQQEAQAYLNSTDWYFARLAETGKPVPEEVLTQRVSARALLND